MDYKNINDYEILYRIEEKDDYAEDIMYKKYLPIIRSIANKYFPSVRNKGVELVDLIQEGNIGLSSAIRTYRDNQNTLFYSYACLCIERQINTYCRKFSSRKHEALNTSYFEEDIIMNTSNKKEVNTLDSISINVTNYEDYIKYKNSFDLDNSCIFELRYNGFTYKEISELLDLSISTIDGRLSKIRKSLQKVLKKTS